MSYRTQRVQTPVHSFEKYKRSHCHGSIAEGSANEDKIIKKVFWDKLLKFCNTRCVVSCRNKKLIQIQNNYNYYYTTNDCYVVCTLHAQVHAFTSHTSSYDFNTCIHHHEWKEQK